MPPGGAQPLVRDLKQLHRPQRRTRIPLSCDHCRARKLRCNREKPCQNCAARGEQATCHFRGSKNEGVSIDHRFANGDEVRDRLDNLEHLVKKLVAERQQVSAPNMAVYTPESPNPTAEVALSAQSETDTQQAMGTARKVVHGVQSVSVYDGQDDFGALLQEINELKRTWDHGQDDETASHFRPTRSHTVDGTSLLFSQVKPMERVEMLSTLPPKPEVDRLIAHFFDRESFPVHILPILHEPTFMHEYNEHWRDPSRTNLIWLGLLFSILGVTMLAFHQHGEPRRYKGISESLFQLYRMRTAQCLLSGDIAKCLPYTVETLRFNATAELSRKDDNRRGLWILTGVLVRAAINMGYHRDPSPGMSALQAEYRRRVWRSVVSMDDMTSFLAGFPRMTAALYSDTEEPRNLHDWELSTDTTVLPPSRPLTEVTVTTFLIVKARLSSALGRVADFNCGPSPGLDSYNTVLEIDRALHEAYQNIPQHVAVAPVEANHKSDSFGGPAGVQADEDRASAATGKASAHLYNLSLLGLYHKGMCTLHRQFLARARVDPRFRFSRDRCLSSALALLDFQPGLEPSTYRLAETRQMLTLAAMVLLLELELRRKAPNADADASPDSDSLLQALGASCARWAEVTDTCDEVSRSHQFLVGMLSSFHTGLGVGTRSGTGSQLCSPKRSPVTPIEVSAPSPRPDTLHAAFSFDTELSDLDFGWATWDAFMEETNDETGPIY